MYMDKHHNLMDAADDETKGAGSGGAVDTKGAGGEDEDAKRAARGDNFDPNAKKDAGQADEGAKGKGAEGDGDADAKAKKAGDGDEEGARGKKSEPRVPKARLDEEIRKRADLEARLREYESRDKKQDDADAVTKLTNQIDELEGKYASMIADGDKDGAAKLRKEIRGMEQQLFSATSSTLSDKARADAVEQVRMDGVIALLESEYAVLNPQNEDEYDQAVVDEILFMRSAFEAKGMPASEAMKAAAGYVMRGVPPASASAKKGLGEGKGDDRKASATKKALDADGKQPPNTADHGKDSDKGGDGGGITKSIDRMSEDEFDALPDSVKRRMRGDELAA